MASAGSVHLPPCLTNQTRTMHSTAASKSSRDNGRQPERLDWMIFQVQERAFVTRICRRVTQCREDWCWQRGWHDDEEKGTDDHRCFPTNRLRKALRIALMKTHTHIHTHVYISVYIYIYIHTKGQTLPRQSVFLTISKPNGQAQCS